MILEERRRVANLVGFSMAKVASPNPESMEIKWNTILRHSHTEGVDQ
jgi:hypothetical protein